ncbi:MAG: High-affinity zinc uptake system binding-protein ZnuA [Gammaproteobacteria bacterium]|nr:High-affinity zinc uptake system binding-protein ZnuA [Gammaproteobacteria bacterium]
MPRGTFRFFLGVFCLYSASVGAQDPPLRVYASIEPIEYFVMQVGGDRVSVQVVVQAGQRPETYEPTPRQVTALAQADVFFGVGLPLEAVWRKQLRGATSRPPQWVDLTAALEEGGGQVDVEHGETISDAHNRKGNLDPHSWLSPVNARHMVSMIGNDLSRLEPAHGGRFEANAAKLRAVLDALHKEIAAVLRESGVESFLVFHPAWGHFAQTYGLEQIAIESGGKEPGPRRLTEVIRRAKDEGIRSVFVDPRRDRRLAEIVAGAIGGDVELLNPLSRDYVNNLRRAAQAIADTGS